MNDNFATKHDVVNQRVYLERKIDSLEERINTKFAEFELSITIKLTATMVFITSAGIAIQTYIIKQLIP